MKFTVACIYCITTEYAGFLKVPLQSYVVMKNSQNKFLQVYVAFLACSSLSLTFLGQAGLPSFKNKFKIKLLQKYDKKSNEAKKINHSSVTCLHGDMFMSL